MTIDGIIEYIFQNPQTGRHLLESELLHKVTWATSQADLDHVQTAYELPSDLQRLWSLAESVSLFEDLVYGQWGLVIASPTGTVRETTMMNNEWPGDVMPGDLAIGTFLGDLQRVVVRCDKEALDYGRVLIGLPLDRRSNWPVVGDHLADFLTRFIEGGGLHFWAG